MKKSIQFLFALFFVLSGPQMSRADSETHLRDAEWFTVFIERVTRIPLNGDRAGYSTGSGFVLDKAQGFIVTNAHVAGQGVGEIKIHLKDKSEYPGEVIYIDPRYDLAIIKTPELANISAVHEARLGDSAKIDIGHAVGTFGNPYRFSFSASKGIVSGIDRTDPNRDFQGEYFQTDAAITAGNSGGPLIDLETGEVIGINTFVWTDGRGNQVPGLGFALKMNVVRETLDRIRSGKLKPAVGWIGLHITEIPAQRAQENYGVPAFTADQAQEQFLLVLATAKGSPAEKEGFQMGDLLLGERENLKLDSMAAYEDLLNRNSGSDLEFSISRREGAGFVRKTIKVRVENANQDPLTKYVKVSGLVAHHLTIKLREMNTLAGGGLYVSHVEEGSKADLVNFEAGDILEAVNGVQITSEDQFVGLLKKVGEHKKVEVQLKRWKRNQPNRIFELEIDKPQLLEGKN